MLVKNDFLFFHRHLKEDGNVGYQTSLNSKEWPRSATKDEVEPLIPNLRSQGVYVIRLKYSDLKTYPELLTREVVNEGHDRKDRMIVITRNPPKGLAGTGTMTLEECVPTVPGGQEDPAG